MNVNHTRPLFRPGLALLRRVMLGTLFVIGVTGCALLTVVNVMPRVVDLCSSTPASSNDSMAALVANIVAEPNLRNVPVPALENTINLRLQGGRVALYPGGTTAMLVVIPMNIPYGCNRPSFDGGPSYATVNVIDRSGDHWTIGQIREDENQFHWADDRWIALVGTYFYHYGFDLWVIGQQHGVWRLLDKPLQHVSSATFSLENGYQTLRAEVSNPYSAPPCSRITYLPAYSGTSTVISETYQWQSQSDKYILASIDFPIKTTVIFLKETYSDVNLPNLTGISVTPYFDDTVPTPSAPFAYHVEQWQPLCEW